VQHAAAAQTQSSKLAHLFVEFGLAWILGQGREIPENELLCYLRHGFDDNITSPTHNMSLNRRLSSNSARPDPPKVQAKPNSTIQLAHRVGRCQATWKRQFELPRREAGPPNHHDEKADSDQ